MLRNYDPEDEFNQDFQPVDFFIKETDRQVEALDLLGSEATQILLYGGTRSGKTIILLYAMIARALKCPGSRHLAARLRFSHAKTSIWHESLPFLLGLLPERLYSLNRSDYYVKFSNGSELWVGGFDDKKRVEKLLGHEYSTILFNESSQIPYDTVVLGLSRLAQKTDLVNKAYFDCNPPSPMHWTHRLFIEGKEPKTLEPLPEFKENYACLLMNPVHNLENLPDNYIKNFLDILPTDARARLRDGIFVKPEGMIFKDFDISMVITRDQLPSMEYFNSGVDFGLNMAGVLMGWCGDNLYFISDTGAFNTVASEFNTQMRDDKGWNKFGNYFAYCDPAGGERIQSIEGGVKANNSVDDGLDFLQTKMRNGQFFVCEDCKGWLAEVWDYKRDEKGRIVKENDHFIDAGRYGAYSFKIPAGLGNKETKEKPITGGLRNERF